MNNLFSDLLVKESNMSGERVERKKTKEKRRKKNGSQREFFCFPLAKTDKTWYNKTYYPPVAQLDNATDSDSGDRGFKSLRADHMNFLLKSEPQRIRTATGSFLFDSSYAVFRDYLLKIYLDTVSEKAEISKPKRLNRMNPNP